MKQEFINAATKGDVERVIELLRVDPKLARATDEKGLSVILKATYYGKKEVVDVLIASGVELNIFEAAAIGRTERIHELVKTNPSLVDAYSVDGFTPLGLAVFFGHARNVRALLAAGADVNSPSKENMKVTPLASAVAAKQLAIARLLIEKGANVNARAQNDFTPLHEAAATGQLELVTLLVENGAYLNPVTKDGKTPLSYALEHKRTEAAEWLKKHGAYD